MFKTFGVFLMIFVCALTVFCASPDMVVADDKWFCPSLNDLTWSNDDNWREDETCSGAIVGKPTLNDRALFDTTNGVTCEVDITTAVADHIVINQNSTVKILAGKKLTTDGTDDVSSNFNVIRLEGADSEWAMTTNSTTIDGDGTIVGYSDSAKITVGTGVTLTIDSGVSIFGQLQITGSGTLVNEGVIHANSNGTLLINTVLVDDMPGAIWKVTTAVGGYSAILQWNPTDTTAPALQGDFEVGGQGTLEVDNKGFHTTGMLTQSQGGVIDVDSADTEVVFSEM